MGCSCPALISTRRSALCIPSKAAAIYAEARMLNGGSDEFRNTITDDGLRAIARDFKLDINESFLD